MAQNKQCVNCEIGYRRFIDDGVYWHSVKESNGMDYDTYVVVCADQTTKGFAAYRELVLSDLARKIENHADTIRILRSSVRLVKKSRNASCIELAFKRSEFL